MVFSMFWQSIHIEVGRQNCLSFMRLGHSSCEINKFIKMTSKSLSRKKTFADMGGESKTIGSQKASEDRAQGWTSGPDSLTFISAWNCKRFGVTFTRRLTMIDLLVTSLTTVPSCCRVAIIAYYAARVFGKSCSIMFDWNHQMEWTFCQSSFVNAHTGRNALRDTRDPWRISCYMGLIDNGLSNQEKLFSVGEKFFVLPSCFVSHQFFILNVYGVNTPLTM